MNDRVADILDNMDTNGLTEDDGLYKIIKIYRQLIDTEDVHERTATIKEYLEPVNKVKTLSDLYLIYGDKRYSINNGVLLFKARPDDYGYNTLWYLPDPMTQIIEHSRQLIGGDENDPERNRFLSYMEEIGYTEDRTAELLENAGKISGIIEKYLKENENEISWYMMAANFADNHVKTPVFEILHKIDAIHGKWEILAKDGFYDLLNELFTEENTAALRDHLIVYSAIQFYRISGFSTLLDMPYEEYRKAMQSTMMSLGHDVLVQEYLKRYLSDDDYHDIKSYTEKIRFSAYSAVEESDILSFLTKENAKKKLRSIRLFAGSNGYSDDLSGFEVLDNNVENIISLAVRAQDFGFSQTALTDDLRKTFYTNMFEVNGYYYSEYNAYTICAGFLCNPMCGKDAVFEERLGYLGRLAAHEMSHSLDPVSIDYDAEGYYEPWLKENEQRAYDENAARIVRFFNGMDAGYGITVNGEDILRETFADIMAIQICLNFLSEQEDPDYDLFFRTFARQNAELRDEDSTRRCLEAGYLPGNLKINYVLGQFDKFYEIYDIDENSPYYVPDEERLKAL